MSEFMRVEDLDVYQKLCYLHIYRECVRMLNGLERTLERQLDPTSRHWPSTPDSEG